GDGHTILAVLRGSQSRVLVQSDQISPWIKQAIVATEDRRFYEHLGIDFPGTLRALGANLRAQGVVQGGSSITQQLAKNLFLNNERTLERKVKEAFLATWLETRLTKKEILKLYLDRAYLGGGAFGVDAAAQYYFNKSVREVNLAESAMLAGLFKAPARFAPHINLSAARARASIVLDNLVEAGFMTEGQVFGARRNPAKSVDRRDEDTPNYYLDWAFRDLQKTVDKQLVGKIGDRVLVVRTGFDPDVQRAADAAVESSLRQYGKDYGASQAAMVIMEPNGLVRAMVGGRDYGESQFNRATDAQRQPGSSFKPYVYITALMQGWKTTSIINDAPLCIGNWCPKNYAGGYAGPVTMLQAVTRSINIPAVRVAEAVGRDKIIATMRKMGVTSEIVNSRPLPLGAADLTVLEHTRAYAHFASGGKSVDSHAAIEIRTPLGEVVWRYDRDGPKPTQVLPPQAVADMNTMLRNAVENGTGRRALIDGFLVSGKTGTTNAYRDAWFMGFTGNYVCGIWIGNDDYSPTRRMTGGSLPALTWQKVMAYAHQGLEPLPVPGLKNIPTPRPETQRVASSPESPVGQRPATLSQRTAERLLRLERLLREAPPPAPIAAQPGRAALASPAETEAHIVTPIRGN
ncbi:MAG: PBP1A family penicillin-binding protein, partial [Xanthobacteraceae bacterium]|nr:PBP1A family penicillin-binding protein [Xanthobacteraceae bacterium]